MKTIIIENISDYEWENYWQEPKNNPRIEQLKKRLGKRIKIIQLKGK